MNRVAPGHLPSEAISAAAHKAAKDRAPSWEGGDLQRSTGVRTSTLGHVGTFETPNELAERGRQLRESGHAIDALCVLTVGEFCDLTTSYRGLRRALQAIEDHYGAGRTVETGNHLIGGARNALARYAR